VKVALRTQQILAYESGVADTVDPLGGSYVIEQLTNELEEHIAKELKVIDDMGVLWLLSSRATCKRG